MISPCFFPTIFWQATVFEFLLLQKSPDKGIFNPMSLRRARIGKKLCDTTKSFGLSECNSLKHVKNSLI